MKFTTRDLSVKRGDDFLFMNVSLNLTEGDALILTGANGSGKSTLLRTLAGLIPPESGRILLQGETIEEGTKAYEACHYLGHKNAMKSELTVAENLSFWKSFLGDFGPSKHISMSIDQAAQAVGLGDILHLPYAYLSAGQQRRMAMAKLLCSYRPIWLLDEPTSALDRAADDVFVSLFNDHLASGGIIVAATHQPLPLTNARFLTMAGFSAGYPAE
jgi:heme exporter protein A